MKKGFVIILALILIVALGGCAGTQADNAVKVLRQKYGCEFDYAQDGIKTYGDTIEAYLIPDFDQTLEIKAVLSRSTHRVTDNLIDRAVGRRFSQELEAALAAKGVDVSSWTTFVCAGEDQKESRYNLSVEVYFDTYHPGETMMYLVLDKKDIGADTASVLTDALSRLGQKYGTEIVLYGAILDEDFERCAAEIKKQPALTSSWFYQFETEDAFQFAVKDGVSNLSIADLQAILDGK